MNTPVETASEAHLPVARRRWLAYSLRSLAILVTVAAIVLAIFAQEIRERWFGPQLPYKVIQNVDDLHEALRAERSVVFFHVRWSIDAENGRIRFHDFAREWRKRMPDTQVRFHVLDLTERERDVVKEAEQKLGQSTTHGSGELLWVRDGMPRMYKYFIAKHSLAELAEQSQKAFGISTIASFPGHPKVSQDDGLWYWDDELPQSSPSSGSESR
jgi:hypothetical protein